MTALPQTNAHVTLITGQGASEDYDTAGAAGASKWHGRQAVYFAERRERVVAAGGVDYALVRSVILPAGDVPLGLVDRGDVLRIQTHDGRVEDAAVDAVERRAVPGLPGTVRVTLRQAPA